MTSHRPRALGALLATALLGFPLAACGGSDDPSTKPTTAATADAGDVVAVDASDTACVLDRTNGEAGVLAFRVTNSGSQPTEFYLYAEDGLRVIGEAANIQPGETGELVVQVEPGTYVTACKPGMTGDGIRGEMAVAESSQAAAIDAEEAALIEEGTATYASYVRDQATQLVEGTRAFAAAYAAGDDDLARSLYASTRTHWERIEPVAESFGDLDPILDAREADLAAGEVWTGWHRIEKDLWPPAQGYVAVTKAQRKVLADRLVADTVTLAERADELTYSADQLGNGAKELLDEVATGKITGEEEIWSHTDLWDFQANLEGARVMYEGLRPVVVLRDPALAETLDAAFADTQAKLDRYRAGDGFVLYTDLTPAQVRELAASVDALSEPLSRLTATVVQSGQ